jgi:hypothetical protein
VVRDPVQTLSSEGVWTAKTTKWHEKLERRGRPWRCLSCVSWPIAHFVVQTSDLGAAMCMAGNVPCARFCTASTGATGGSTGQGQYNETYSYNAIGNLMSKGGVTYTYPDSGEFSVRPHAVTSTSNGGSFSYNSNPTPLRSGDCAAT